MKKAIKILNAPLEFDLKDCIQKVRNSYKKQLIISFEDPTSDLNKIIKDINYRNLKDKDIYNAIINRFKKYDCYNNYNVNKLKNNPKELQRKQRRKLTSLDVRVVIR